MKNNALIPKLIFSDKPLDKIIKSIIDKDTIIIADDFNYPKLRNFDRTYLVDRSTIQQIQKVKNDNEYRNVIAIGGCSALDFGRACAKKGGKLTIIPSILSTSCISVNRSIVYANGHHESLITPIPSETIISFPLLLDNDYETINKWSHSGFGDLFANISAAINYLFKKNKLFNHANNNININDLIYVYTSDCMDALDWVNSSFKRFDKITLKQLACYLHRSSVNVIKRKNTELSAAGEHDLYYQMMNLWNYDRRNPTHGELVSIGTLFSVKILNEGALYQKVKKAFLKLGIPTNYDELHKINIEIEHIEKGLFTLTNKDTFLSNYFNKKIIHDCYRP